MKPTCSSHAPPRFLFPDPAGSWVFVENLRPGSDAADVFQVYQPPNKNASLGPCRPDAAEADPHEVFEDSSKSGSVDPWTSWKDDVSSRRRLLRSRSLIRTNPWMSPTGQSPPRSPAADVHLFRCWSDVERSTSSTKLPLSPNCTQTGPINSDNETVMSSRFYRRDDSLLTTSIESDSLYQSLTSDTDTAASLMSVSDVTLPETSKEERVRDVVSKISSEEKRIDHYKTRFGGDHDRRELSGTSFDSGDFGSEEIKNCGRTWSSGHSFDLQLKHPSFGGNRFSEIAEDYEAKTTKWLNSGESGITKQQLHTTPDIDISVARGGDFAEQLNPRPSTNIPEEILTDQESFDTPIYETESSPTSRQFRKKILAVRSSLQDKVATLRREKRVVDEKIREAKEEEKIRLVQLDKFRRQLSSTRKEILLRTLDELRQSLTDQSLKLQKLYDIVLLEQRQQILCC